MDEEGVLGVWHVARGRKKRNTQGLGEEIYREDDIKVDHNEVECCGGD